MKEFLHLFFTDHEYFAEHFFQVFMALMVGSFVISFAIMTLVVALRG